MLTFRIKKLQSHDVIFGDTVLKPPQTAGIFSDISTQCRNSLAPRIRRIKKPSFFYRSRQGGSDDPGLDKAYVYTRAAPDGARRPVGRITAEDLAHHGWPPDFEPTCYVCGPTGFVETAADLLVALGHDPGRVRTERFGPSG